MSDNIPTPDWGNPPAQEPSFVNPDAPTIQAFDSSSLPPPPPPPSSSIDYSSMPSMPPTKKSSKTWIWIVVVVVVLLLCCCCTGIAGYYIYSSQGSGAFGPSGFLPVLLI